MIQNYTRTLLPKDRKDIEIDKFQKSLEVEKLKNDHNHRENFLNLKFTVIKVIITILLPLLLIGWVVTCWLNAFETKKGIEWVLQTIGILYAGALISKD